MKGLSDLETLSRFASLSRRANVVTEDGALPSQRQISRSAHENMKG